MRCSSCNFDNAAGKKFCIHCGASLPPRCPKCGSENPPQARFCGDCGTALAATPSSSAQRTSAAGQARPTVQVTPEHADTSSAPDGERKTVTALFADIKGSTELEQDLDPEEARAIVDPALKLMIEAARRYDGYVVQSTGDGIFALFGAPLAHEDHPQRALYAALRMQEELRRYGDKLLAAGRAPLEIRVGVNSGEVVVRSISTGGGNVEYTPIGHTTNLASRMQTVAPTGSIAITEHTRRLVEGYFALKPRGPTPVKGISEPVNVYQVTGLGPLRSRLQRSAGRGLSSLVGRDHELEAIGRAAALAAQGHGQIVATVAEAGVGKSRLFHEFKARTSPDWMILEAYSVSHGKASAFLPVIELLSNYFKFGEDDDARSRREKVAGRLAILDASLENTRPYVLALLGITDRVSLRTHWEASFDRLDEYLHEAQAKDPFAQMDVQVRRRRTLDAIKRILLRESLNQPLMLIFEDLHWIDAETQAMLDLLADSIATSRILILVNYRPEYSHTWTNKSYYTQLRLDPLSPKSAEQLLTVLLGNDASLKALKTLIAEKTQGNPFFMEEIVQGLFEEGTLARNGTTKLTRALDTLGIPPTVRAMLAARIDRLPHDAKDLLQALAVIGREFPLALIRALIAKSDDELNRLLNDLQLGEFIYEQPAMGDTEYVFKHALTQEVAYNSLLIERRKHLHERIGAALEQQFAANLDDHLGELAHHYSRSNDPAKAFEYMARAAEQAGRRSAYSEIIAHIDAALGLLAALPESEQRDLDELRVRITLGPALMAVKGFSSEETRRSCERACEIARRRGAATALFTTLNFLWGFHFTRGDAKSVLEVSRELTTIAQQMNEPGMLKDACRAMGRALTYSGDLLGARRYLEEAISLGGSSRTWAKVANVGPDAEMLCLTGLSEVLLFLGDPDQALDRANQALAAVDAKRDPFSFAMALASAAETHNRRREPEKTLEILDRALALCDEHGYPFWTSVARRMSGWALTLKGQVRSGIEMMEEELTRFSGTDSDMVRYQILLYAAEAWQKIGEYERAAAILDEWQSTRRTIAIVLNDAFYHRLRGNLLCQTHGDDAAAAEYRESIAIARGMNDRYRELQAALDLAPLLTRCGRRGEARAMLAEIYNWFTEGFDTADLKDARALLDELSS
jgi:class 3 adenylate cyclase/tetratricopeptide (TPR) repeat protein/ribosomal protein L40E